MEIDVDRDIHMGTEWSAVQKMTYGGSEAEGRNVTKI